RVRRSSGTCASLPRSTFVPHRSPPAHSLRLLDYRLVVHFRKYRSGGSTSSSSRLSKRWRRRNERSGRADGGQLLPDGFRAARKISPRDWLLSARRGLEFSYEI